MQDIHTDILEVARMADKSNYYVVREKAVPEVLLKVVEAKRLLDSGKLESFESD